MRNAAASAAVRRRGHRLQCALQGDGGLQGGRAAENMAVLGDE